MFIISETYSFILNNEHTYQLVVIPQETPVLVPVNAVVMYSIVYYSIFMAR